MSAYIVDTATIDAICYAARRYDLDLRIGLAWEYVTAAKIDAYPPHGDTIGGHRTDVIGQILLEQNYRSVNYRYREDEVAPAFRPSNRSYSLGEMLGCCRNYDYQACETPDYGDTGIPSMLANVENCVAMEALATLGQAVPYGMDGHDMAERYRKRFAS